MTNEQIEEVAHGKLVEWYSVKLTAKQLEHMKMLCRFHVAESQNEYAIKLTKKLQWCLDHWPQPVAAIEKNTNEDHLNE